MIREKEFYFVRHGQTDHNISSANLKVDQPTDIPLNETGRAQAQKIEPLISSLLIRTVCASPMRRVQETKELITPKLQASHHAIPDLGECSAATWREMAGLGMYSPLPETGSVRNFMDRVQRGVNEALLLPGPLLIVAHGGIHWALCCLLRIEDHKWGIDNCIPVHFSIDETGKWTARKLA